ncbi:unnamed protein product [Thelazia callipaeda]|uniref:UDP-glucuronosyltransferase n=1 Tax=Thelazia callipaeda TaxID=103827 RepID=A0A0N5DCC9_THECL|nr:unnamed protein product [Thelazia callipaeda]
MTYSQRLFNFASVLFMKCWFKHVIRNDQKIFQRLYGENFIDLEEKLAQATFVLESSNPFFNIPKPTIYKVLELGGLGIPKAQPLSDASCICIHIISEWSKVMNENKKVILVSFGTVAFSYLMPNETKQALLQTFNEFSEVIFIWKYEKEEDNIAEGYPNVITAKWLPQTDLLAHPNLVAFLTHGGMNSIMQTLSFGKPVIVVPLFMDQLQNAALIQRSRTGILLQLSKLIVKQKLRQAIHEIIYNTMYLQNAKRISEMMAKRPNPAKEQLIRHVEFAAEFGQIPNFDPYGRKLSFVTYYMLDIIIPCIFVIFCIISGICWLIFSILRKLYRKLIQNNQCIAVENGEKKNQ